jgi:hypothetical protein
MAREHFLCSASGIKDGERRTFTVYKLRGQTFKIYNDRGNSHVSHSSLHVTDRDIESEIITVYNVYNVKLEGSINAGVKSSTWPDTCEACLNCNCQRARRNYGGQGYCQRCYYLACRLETANRWCFGEPKSLGQFIPDPNAAYLSRLSVAEFSEYKENYLSWMRKQLDELKIASDHRLGNLTPSGLAAKFNDVLKIMDRNAKLSIDETLLGRFFDNKQMAIIFSLLDDMIDASVRNSDRCGFTAGFEAVTRLKLAQQKRL